MQNDNALLTKFFVLENVAIFHFMNDVTYAIKE